MKIAQTYSIFNVKCCAGNVFSPFTTDKHKQGQGHKWHQWSFTHILDKRDRGLSPLFLPWDVYCLSSQWSGGGLRSRPTMWGRWEGLGKSFEWREITTRVALYITMESWTWGRAMWQTSLQLAIKHQGETIRSAQQTGMIITFFFLPLTKSPAVTIVICSHLSVNFTRW